MPNMGLGGPLQPMSLKNSLLRSELWKDGILAANQGVSMDSYAIHGLGRTTAADVSEK